MTDVVPRFVTVAERVLVVPAWTLPKARVEFRTDNMPFCWSAGPALTPWQPARIARLATISNAAKAFHDWERVLARRTLLRLSGE